MSRPGTTLATQKLEYDEINWSSVTRYGNAFAVSAAAPGFLQPLPALGTVTSVTNPPMNLSTGMDADRSLPPYWVFSYKIDAQKGLMISGLNAKDTQSAGSIEEVFEKIEFSDLKIFFNDGTSMIFDMNRALTSPTGSFVWLTVGEAGAPFSDPSDTLYQRGLKLEIFTNVLQPTGGTCFIRLAFSLALRGSKNDFDPGGVPVAMITWPQYSFEWSSDRATKRVVKFIGSIKISMNNKMHSSHMHHGAPLNENLSGFFADSNTSLYEFPELLVTPLAAVRSFYYPDNSIVASVAAKGGNPFGWSIVFDYLKYNIASETEIVAVNGPLDGTKYSSLRESRYQWIPATLSPGLKVRKAPRQGMYDNIHNHAKMSSLDINGNVQVHAPFCGHSCVHTHWRWSNISSRGFVIDTPKYQGWGPAGAHSLHDAPKAPTNQKVKIALCRNNANSGNGGNSFSDTNILNPATLGALDLLHKTFWYRSEIIAPNAGESQVVMEQGIGWAFRYATRGESGAVRGLAASISNSLPWFATPTQHEISSFFEDSVYPTFRYKGTTDQIPQGSHNTLITGIAGTSMEDL
jgi:hypothetical protein